MLHNQTMTTPVSHLVKIDKEMRPWEWAHTDRQAHTQTNRQTDANRFYYLSHAICYSYRAYNNAENSGSVKMFADDTKLCTVISDEFSAARLQSYLDYIHSWSTHWQLKVSPTKCTVMHLNNVIRKTEHSTADAEYSMWFNTTCCVNGYWSWCQLWQPI